MRIKDTVGKIPPILKAAIGFIGRTVRSLLLILLPKRIAGAFFRWWKIKKGEPFYRTKKIFRLACAAAFLFFCISMVLNLWLEGRSSGRVYLSAKEVPQKTAAIVLGAAVYSGGKPSPILEDRLLAAEQLYRLGKVHKILLSGDHGKKRYDETTGMHRFLQKRKIPERDIFLDHAGFRTLDTMFRAALVFGVKDAVICTQKFHLARSLFLAEQAGIDAVGFQADRRRYRHHFLNLGRETFATFAAVFDIYIVGRKPRFLGDPISIVGDGSETRD
jgi:SanA protein